MPDSGFERTQLGSKARVLTEFVPGTHSVSLGFWMDTGSRDENKGQAGLCHLLEHMLFKGTPSLSAKQIAEKFDSVGAEINAATGREHTTVYCKTLSEHLPRAVEIITDMLVNPILDPCDVDSERRVVLEEIAMHRDSPDELVHDQLAGIMWGDHPAGHMVLGEDEVIRNADSATLKNFHLANYVAPRLVVAAAGKVGHLDLVELVSEKTKLISKGEYRTRSDSMKNPMTGVSVFEKDTEQAHTCIGSKGLPRMHPDRFALSLMDNILGGSMSSRLFQKIREEKGLAYSIYSYSGMLIGMGMVGIYCGTMPTMAQKAIELIENELVRISKKGFTKREIKRAKNHIKGALYIGMEESANRMNRIAKVELAGGEQLSLDEIVDRVMNVTEEDLEGVFKKTWGSNNSSLAVIGPFKRNSIELSGRI